MKHLVRVFALLATLLLGCTQDGPDPVEVLNEDGFSPEIVDLVPPEVLDSLRKLGMPLYGGAAPPDLSGSYRAEPVTLVRSNYPLDYPGKVFNPLEFTLSDQDNEALTIRLDYTNGGESGADQGGFLAGDDCNFTVFVDLDSISNVGSKAKAIFVYSGTIADDGIRGLYVANLILDDRGDPRDIWLEIGQGRLFHDQDGFSPRTTAQSTDWYDRLPDCPCEYTAELDGRQEDCGTWLICSKDPDTYHFGATTEIRWVPAGAGGPGQQCTYDAEGKLITGGIAAGSPDRVSPLGCDQYDTNTWSKEAACGHAREDVIPWGGENLVTWVCPDRNARPVNCETYLANWPANQGNGCTENVVNGIDHLLRMVQYMNCQEVTDFMRYIYTSEAASEALKSFVRGETTDAPSDLRDQFTALMETEGCNPRDEGICSLLLRARMGS